MKSVLLTRSCEDNAQIIKNLISCGLVFVSCPMLKYFDIKIDTKLFDNFNNIVITSKRAVINLLPYINSLYYKKKLRFWLVGNQSSALLHQYRFNIVSVYKSVEDLEKAIRESDLTSFLYLSGSIITKNLPIRREIIYHTQYLDFLTNSMINLFEIGFDYIPVYSKETGRTLLNIVKKYNLFNFFTNTTIIAISDQVGNQFKPYTDSIIYCNSNPLDIVKILKQYATPKN